MIEYKHFSAQFSVYADGSFEDTEDLRTSFYTNEFLIPIFLSNFIVSIENIL